MNDKIDFVQSLYNAVLKTAGQAMTTTIDEITALPSSTENVAQIAEQRFNASLYTTMLNSLRDTLGDDETLLTIDRTARSKLTDMESNVDKAVIHHQCQSLYTRSAIAKLNMGKDLCMELFTKVYRHANCHAATVDEVEQRCLVDAELAADIAAYVADVVVYEGR